MFHVRSVLFIAIAIFAGRLHKASSSVSICQTVVSIAATTVLDVNGPPSSDCGPMPTEIGLLVNLVSIDLQGEGYNGPMPTELGNLALLTSLNLESNSLTGPVPSEVGRLQQLSALGLGNNQLSGEISPILGKLLDLRLAFIFNNFFAGSLGPEMGNLAQLSELNLGLNNLNGHVPVQIGKLQNLALLDMEQNDFSGSLPTTVGELAKLTLLDINRNMFSGSFPKELPTLLSMRLLFMQGNLFTGPLPSTLGNLANLEELVAHENQFESLIPTEMGRMTNVKFLTLQGNELTGPIPSQLGNLGRLDGLNLENNQLNGKVPSTFTGLTLLTSFFLIGLSVTNKFSIATCSSANIYKGLSPHVLISDADAPCSHPNFVNRTVFDAREAEVAWTYPFPGEVASVLPDFSVATWDDGQVAIGFQGITDMFHNCSREFRASSSDFAGIDYFAFLLSWQENEVGAIVNRQCEFAKDLEAGAEYRFVIPDLVPNTAYEVNIIPMLVEFELFREPNYIFGPESTVFDLVTAEDNPDSAPLNLAATAREADRLDIVWNPPSQPNGELSYAIACSCGQSGVSQRTSFSFTGLSPRTEYTLTVTPFTSIGPGPNACLTLRTCQESTRATPATQDVCFAQPGFFLSDDQFSALSCGWFVDEIVFEACANAGSVTGVNTSSLVMREGFWRTSEESADFRQCPIEGACVGGLVGELCEANHTGPLCAVCETGFYFNGRVCASCTRVEVEALLIPLVLVCVVALLYLTAVVYSYRVDKGLAEVPYETKAKVLLNTYQIVSTFSWSLGLIFPEAYTLVLFNLSFITLDFIEIFPSIQCSYDSRFLTELQTVVFAPLVTMVMVALFTLLSTHRLNQGDERFRSLKDGGLRLLVVISYVVYTPVTNKAFRALRPCDRFDTGEAFLHEDYRVECSTEEYEDIRGLAIFAVTVYSSLTPLCYLFLLNSGKRAIEREFEQWTTPEQQELRAEDKRRLRNMKVLYKSYTPERWWWEFYETIRKFVLTGAIVLIAPGSLEQSVFLIIFAGVASLIYQEFRPFKEKWDHVLGLVSSYCIFLTAFIALLLKFSRELDILDPNLVDLISLFAVLAPVTLALVFGVANCVPCVPEHVCAGDAGQVVQVDADEI